MGRFDIEGVKYETRGAMQGAQVAQAFKRLSEYRRSRRLQNYKPKIVFNRSQNLTYNHLIPFDMNNFLLKRSSPKSYAYCICAFSVGCIVFSKMSQLIYDQDVRYIYLVKYPNQMKTFDSIVESISSKFWQIGRDYFGDYVIPSIRSEQDFYNFTYAVKNKIFKTEERKAKSQSEFTVLKSKAIQSDQDIEKFDDVVHQQDKEMKRMLWKLEDEQLKQQAEKDKLNQ